MSDAVPIGHPSIGELTVEEARARMLACVPGARAETTLLDAVAVGRVLAEPITAVRDQPPFNASAMDGWAIPTTAAPGDFRIIGESAAGHAYLGAVGEGEAVRIFTGALVPTGCRVVVQEASERTETGVLLAFDPDGSLHVRRRGGDFAAGDVLLPAGTRLDPWRLALAAAAGRASAQVAKRPRAGILSTGDEVVRAGEGATDEQIFDAGGPALSALVSAWGGVAMPLNLARDATDAIVAAVEGVECDVIVTIGGASVGDHDLVKPALKALGLVLHVDTVRIRPGKPTWFGTLKDGRLVLGLPGNPASALVCAELFLRPVLAHWLGADAALPMQTARLTAASGRNGPREHWMRGALSTSPEGALLATPFPDQESSLVSVFAAADCLIRRPAGAPEANVGAPVQVLRLARL